MIEVWFVHIFALLIKQVKVMETKVKIDKGENGVIKSIRVSKIPIESREKNGKFIVFCPVFKVIGYSQINMEDATNDLLEALDVFFGIHVGDKTLHEVLLKFGFNHVNDSEVSTSPQNGNIMPIPFASFNYSPVAC